MMNVPAGDRAGLLELIAWDTSKEGVQLLSPSRTWRRWVWRGRLRAMRSAPGVDRDRGASSAMFTAPR